MHNDFCFFPGQCFNAETKDCDRGIVCRSGQYMWQNNIVHLELFFLSDKNDLYPVKYHLCYDRNSTAYPLFGTLDDYACYNCPEGSYGKINVILNCANMESIKIRRDKLAAKNVMLERTRTIEEPLIVRNAKQGHINLRRERSPNVVHVEQDNIKIRKDSHSAFHVMLVPTLIRTMPLSVQNALLDNINLIQVIRDVLTVP